MKVITRFAPSPTGDLHIGGARTALFNFLYAKHTGGEFKLRIEDTDKKRSTKDFEKSIIDGLSWIGLDFDGDPVYQSERENRHAEVAHKLVENGHAYYCYTPLEEIQNTRNEYKERGKVFKFQSEWRDKTADSNSDKKPVVRFKAPQEGVTTIEDIVQGKVTVPNSELDDMVLLRADGTPTYMLAVVVDDYDMGITHVIRGDDHLNNAFRQIHIYHAMKWATPLYAHIPLIHAMDGSKLSKRHGALGVMQYKNEGYLPEALINYLLRLGWGHGNDEIISQTQAIAWFDINGVNKNPAKLDFNKMLNLNAHYIKHSANNTLVKLIEPILGKTLDSDACAILEKGMEGLKLRAKTLLELAENAKFYIADAPLSISKEAKETLDTFDKNIYKDLVRALESISPWKEENIKSEIKDFATKQDMKLGQIAGALRAALTGSSVSPSVFDIMAVLGKEKSIARIGVFC